jgi:hypothetical protein
MVSTKEKQSYTAYTDSLIIDPSLIKRRKPYLVSITY